MVHIVRAVGGGGKGNCPPLKNFEKLNFRDKNPQQFGQTE